MATPEVELTTDAPETAPADLDGRGWRPYRLSVRQYLKMIAAGVFPDDARVELLGGILVEQMTKGIAHDYSLSSLCDQLRPLLPVGMILREDKSLRISARSRPEPDIAIVAGPRSRYQYQDPTPREVALIVEVADTSYADDRGIKWRLYAKSRIPTYWIVNLARRQVEVYLDPAGRGSKAEYRATEIYGEGAAVPVVIAGDEVGSVSVAELLPSAPAAGA